MSPDEFEAAIVAAGRTPMLRTTTYERVSQSLRPA